MPTTCPHCGTRSPERADACTGCGRDLYRLSDPATVPSLWLSFRPSRSWLWITAGAVVVLLGAGASTGMLLNDGNRNDNAAEERLSDDEAPGPAVSIDPTPSPSASSKKPSTKALSKPAPTKSKPPSSAPPKPAPSATPDDGLPAGFSRVVDEMGFSLGVTKGWTRRPLSATHVDYVPPTGLEILRIGDVAAAPKASFTNFMETEAQLQANDPSYQRIRLEHITFQGQTGALWEFRWTNAQTGEVMHAKDQAYISPEGTEYSIYFEGRERLWDEQVFTTAVNSWKVQGTLHANERQGD